MKVTYTRIASKKGGLKDRFQARIFSKVDGKMKAINLFSASLTGAYKPAFFKTEDEAQHGLTQADFNDLRDAYMQARSDYAMDLRFRQAQELVTHEHGIYQLVRPCLTTLTAEQLESLITDADSIKKDAKAQLKRLKKERETNKLEQVELTLGGEK